VRRRRTWDVDVPAGIEDGQRIRISGAGHSGEHGAPAGDLYVEVRVRADERFERHGEHLITPARIGVTRAMLGGKIQVPTLNGPREVEVPKGAQPGQRIVVKGEGLPRLEGRRRGDQHVVLEVVVPDRLSRKQRAAAQELDDLLDEP
jgi:molecular chaperone DnaJ